MKRSLFVLATALCVMMAQAADYPYLVFTNTGGTTTVLGVANLTLTVSGNSLEVSNTEGTTTFVLTELANMQFSKDGSTILAVDQVLDAEQPVSVYSMTGVLLGTYNSLTEGVEALCAGAYVIKQGKNSQTIVVK